MSFTHTKKIHLLAAIVGLLALSAVAFAGSAAASLPSNCAAAAGTVECTFGATGATQDFTVPAGVTSAAAVAAITGVAAAAAAMTARPEVSLDWPAAVAAGRATSTRASPTLR